MKWQPTLAFLRGKSHGQRSLVGYSPWGHEEPDTTERLQFHFLCPQVSDRLSHKAGFPSFSWLDLLFSHPVMSDSLRTPWTAARQASLSITTSQSLLNLKSTESVMPSSHLILRGLLLPLPSAFLRIRVFFSELALQIGWPKYWSFSFSISPSNEYSVLISLRMGWFDLLAV